MITGQSSGPAAATSPVGPAERPRPQIERLQVRGLAKRFGAVQVLHGLDLDIAGGEFISLLGPSGCGKTTALNCIAGLIRPDAGSVEVDGRDVSRQAPERRHFGMVFQNYALFPHLSVAGNLAFGLQMLGVHRREAAERVAQALGMVQLSGLGDRYPAQLSGGQQQRVALARTLVTRPRLVLMDEPLSNLDAKLRLEMRTELRRLHLGLGLTTIFVTHDQEEALSLSDRIVLMRDGRIEQSGTPEDVYGQPRTAYAAGFLGYRNLLPVTVETTDTGLVRVSLQGTGSLSGTAHGTLAAGAQAVAAIRPDHVLVGAGIPAGASIPSRVEVTEFSGGHFEATLRTAGGTAIVARISERLPIGSEVRVQLPPDRLFVFPAEAA